MTQISLEGKGALRGSPYPVWVETVTGIDAGEGDHLRNYRTASAYSGLARGAPKDASKCPRCPPMAYLHQCIGSMGRDGGDTLCHRVLRHQVSARALVVYFLKPPSDMAHDTPDNSLYLLYSLNLYQSTRQGNKAVWGNVVASMKYSF